MSIGIDCGGQIVTDPVSGALECQATDGTNASVAWSVTPSFDVSQLDPGSLTAYFCWGWFIVAFGWGVGKGIGIVVRVLRSL